MSNALKHGTADFTTTVRVSRKSSFGGFDVWETDLGARNTPTIFVSAKSWKGIMQPRMAVEGKSEGYADWKAVLDADPDSECDESHTFVGADCAAKNKVDQWLTSGPTMLMG